MIPPTPDFFEQFTTDHRRREAAATAERLRRFVVGRVIPTSVPPRTVATPAAVHVLRPARSRDCRHAA